MPLISQPFIQLKTLTGRPYSNAYAEFYEAGTANHLAVYTTDERTTAYPWPVVASAEGVLPSIYTDPAYIYRMKIFTEGGELIVDVPTLSGGLSVGRDDIEANAIGPTQLANESVTAAKLAPQSVSNAKMTLMPNNTLKGTLVSANGVKDLTRSDVIAILGLVGTYRIAAYSDADDDICLIADGRSLLRTGTYSRLFTAIGTLYGAADGTHFNLPDLRGYNLVGADLGRGLPEALPAVGNSHADQMQRIFGVIGGILPNSYPSTYGTTAPFYLGSAVDAHTGNDTGSAIVKDAFIDTASADAISAGYRAGATTHGRELAACIMIYY